MTNTITLAGKTYPVKVLTLGDMRTLGMGSARQRGAIASQKPSMSVAEWGKMEGEWYDATFDIIAAATNVTREELTKLVGVTFDEIMGANETIMRIAGLIAKKEEEPAKPGEAKGATG